MNAAAAITATLVRDLPRSNSGAEQKLWLLSAPIEVPVDCIPRRKTTHVVTSAVHAFPTGPETYIFCADECGEVVCWTELDGSYRGGLDHLRAIHGAGWVEAAS